MRQRAQPARVGQHLLAFGHRFLTGQHHIGRFTGPYVAPGQQMRKRIKQGGVERALMVLNPPTPGLYRYGEKRVQAPPGQVKNDKQQGQQQQHQVERQIQPVRRPKQGDATLVVPNKQRHGRSHRKQRQQPQRSAHAQRPAAAVASAASVSSTRGSCICCIC